MANMIKFYRGLLQNLPTTGENGALYITTDEGAIYYGTGTSMKRLGDYIMVDAIENLPADGANATSLYYCVKENVLCRFDSTTNGWVQINKQPDIETLKTQLGLGTLAYKSEVAEGDLNADLKAKIDASSAANHSHANKDELDLVATGDVAKWNAAEKNAKDYADDLDEAMNTRVEALEAVDHTHANKALLDTYTQTEENLADAVAKKHEHANKTELDKIVEGDKAKWDAVAADHLTSADKTALENSIKEAKKAGTDANTNIETYKVTNDARVLAVEEDIAEITNADNGIFAQAKAYSDGKLATARTEVSAEIDADVKVVNDALEAYKSANDTALAGVKATAEAAATKEYTDAELAKKVDKVTGKSLVSDTEITKLAGVSEGANKVEASENNGKIKIDGVETTVYTHPEKHAIAEVDGLGEALAGFQVKGDYAADDHKHVKADITDFAHTHTASEITDLDATIKGYDYATKTEAQGYANAKDEAIAAAQKAADDITAYVGTFTASEGVDTVVKYIDAKTANIASDDRVDGIDERLTQAEKDIDAIETDYLKAADKTELEGKITAEKQRAEGIEGGLRTDVDAVAGRMTTAEGKITTLETESAKHAIKTEVEAALALKADKSVVDAMYTNEQIDAAILVEKERAELAEAGLQTQINTIMNNPDTEGVINSINEFTQYIADHGEIADGFRADIDKNKEDIAANTKAIADETTRATGAEEALGGRIDELKASYDEHTHSWNDLTDKPFGEKTIESINVAAEDFTVSFTPAGQRNVFYKVSDEVFTVSQLTGATVKTGNATNTFSEDNLVEIVGGCRGSNRLVSIYDTTVEKFFEEGETEVWPSTGTYVGMTSATDTDIVFQSPVNVVKTLDDKFISSSIARTADVNASVEALEAVDTALSGRLDALEAIDHDAYVDADATLKSELQGEIDADVKVVSDALTEYKTANDTEVGKKANAADVYAKTETYTKDEVDAAVEAAVTAATEWGSF